MEEGWRKVRKVWSKGSSKRAGDQRQSWAPNPHHSASSAGDLNRPQNFLSSGRKASCGIRKNTDSSY